MIYIYHNLNFKKCFLFIENCNLIDKLLFGIKGKNFTVKNNCITFQTTFAVNCL